MESRISQTELSALLALASGKSKELCEAFVKRFCEIICETLAEGESVRIKGFGSFKLLDVESRKSVNVSTGEEYEIPQHKRIVFVASKELASKVNLPFEAFEAIELVDDETIMEDLPDEEKDEDEEREEEEQEIETAENSRNSATPEHLVEQTQTEPMVTGAISAETEHLELSEPRFRFAKGFFVGFLAAVVVICGLAVGAYYLGYFSHSPAAPDVKNEKSSGALAQAVPIPTDSTPATPDTVKIENSEKKINPEETVGDDVPTKPSDVSATGRGADAPVYDTVTTTRYLTTIAKEHYGNFNLWPIIYEENQAILGHPDRIKPGTRVVVPPLSKYNIDPKDEAQIKQVKRRGVAIYARFKK